MDKEALKNAIREALPGLLREDPSLREYVMSLTERMYAGKEYTEDRFWEVLTEMRQDREEQSRKWAEAKADSELKWGEQNKKWDEQNKKWDEQSKKWDEQSRNWEKNQNTINEMLAEMKRQHDKHNSSIGALGSRWGLFSEEAFRNGLRAILEESFGVKVLNVTEYDHAGEVFGRPDQVELDVIVFNGILILCEIKSSVSKPDLHFFDRKAAYYAKHHQREVNRKIVISPMVDPRAVKLAEELGIEVYSHSYDVVGRWDGGTVAL